MTISFHLILYISFLSGFITSRVVISPTVQLTGFSFFICSQELEYALKIFNYFFTAVFLLELSMKVVALGIPRYLTDK